MAYFQVEFQRPGVNAVEHNGRMYCRYFDVVIDRPTTLQFTFLETNSKYTQGIVVGFPREFKGKVLLDGRQIKIKKSAFRELHFWEDTAPRSFCLTVSDFEGELFVCNSDDPLGNKMFCKHLTEGSAMHVREVAENTYRFYCLDHAFGDRPDNLVFEMKVSPAIL